MPLKKNRFRQQFRNSQLLTPEELQLVVQLCDLALRTQGLQAANAVLPLAARCQALLAQPAVQPIHAVTPIPDVELLQFQT
jgi:hypothetical protein